MKGTTARRMSPVPSPASERACQTTFTSPASYRSQELAASGVLACWAPRSSRATGHSWPGMERNGAAPRSHGSRELSAPTAVERIRAKPALLESVSAVPASPRIILSCMFQRSSIGGAKWSPVVSSASEANPASR
ncbi:hypothetical protein GCM10020000_70910 [Streptomyces olivoverticillatus]